MSVTITWYLIGVALPVGVLVVAYLILGRLLEQVLTDLLGSSIRARFFKLAFFAMLVTITVAGSLLSGHSIVAEASNKTAHLSNTARQVLAAVLALLLGLGATGAILVTLIYQYELRRLGGGETPDPSQS